MNLRRGMIRLWVVFTILWLIAAGAAGMITAYVHRGGMVPWKVGEEDEYDEYRVSLAAAVGCHFVEVCAWDMYPSQHRDDERRAAVMAYAAAVSAVPLIALALGAGLGWVASGFRAGRS